MSKYNELVKKLKEIFQIDKPELDFGIYRILNAKADEINNYLENTLKKKISDALASAGNANKEELERQLAEAIKNAEGAGFNPDDSPKVKDLRAQIAASSQGANEHENAVFTHLLTFFSRYYDSGDFVSKRRYKGDTYAIPYAGEEVMLHWANKDQYYIKSGENFSNYSFKLEDGRKVTFKLLAADTAKDNRKDNDADRRFVLVEQHTRIKYDDEGLDYEEEVLPIFVDSSGEQDELVIQFEYKAVKKGTKQEALVNQALDAILSNSNIQSDWVDVTKREPTEKNPNRTLLEKHLTTYTQRNTADYFIHKDLGGFLSNELDFYIKNEVMNLDNVQNAEVFSDIEKQLRMIQCFRNIATEITTFLSQLENFQKRLWEKKKFIAKYDYCISLDLIPESMYASLLSSSSLIGYWKKTYNIDSLGFRAEDALNFIREHNKLTVDTSVLESELKTVLIDFIGSIERPVTGTLINSDNYQALRLIKEKYQNKIDCIYIDPPYNTNATPILYKNGFKSSSWLSLIENRISTSLDLLNKECGYLTVAIDDNEIANLSSMLSLNYSNYELHKCIVNHYPGSGTGRSNVSRTHEYALFVIPEGSDLLKGEVISGGTRERGFCRSGQGDNNFRHGRPNSFYALLVDAETKEIKGIEEPPQMGINYPVEDTTSGLKRIYPLGRDGSERCWTLSYETAKKHVEGNTGVLFVSDSFVAKRRYFDEESRGLLPSLWADKKYSAVTNGTNLLTAMFGEGGLFSYPKSVYTVDTAINAGTYFNPNALVLDYFAGSGTTAHALIEMNRKDGGDRRFILVEQGDYFSSVTKPRVLKAAFSSSWNAGVPTNIESGMTQLIECISLESYEDTLNNLELRKPQTTGDLFDSMPEQAKSDYLLNYMLETESKGSLLSTDDFKKPFDYKMKIAVDSAGAYEERNIDLVETFNYLIGLHVNTVESNIERGYVRVEGNLPSGEKALFLWRDCEKIDYDDFTKFANRFDLFAKEKTFDVIYVNGDHNLPTAFTSDEGEVTRTLKLRQIEPEFLELMFAPDELA